MTAPLFVRACRGETTERTPLWLMRQAGRYLPEYRQVRAGVSFLELCKSPKLAAEVTLQPIRRFGFDAAILFSDLLVPLEAMGLEVEFTDEGPRLPRPVRTAADLGRVAPFDPAARTPFVMETIARANEGLGGTPLIGFAGAPFTVATYAIEGKTSKSFGETKRLFYERPDDARRLLGTIAEATRDYLLAQIRAGAAAVQLFDSWVGVLSAEDFETFALPPTAALVASLREAGVPVIYFANGAAAILDRVARVGADVYGVDWRLPLDEARARLGGARAVQGNLDPAVLLGPPAEIARRARDVVRRGGKRGHVFNLGHGITPDVPLESVAALVDAVRSA
ncbi:MAG TPA: uroporphyrinogen decarboxylase [Polyangia bacterium]|nr:uroporphyrinogen decarboxylase [Polyangia bacterium]